MSIPVYHDLWGYPVNWMDPNDGWNQDKRKFLIYSTNHIITQSASLTNYTEIGYLKMPIQPKLYQQILEQRQIQKSSWELTFQGCKLGASNCLAIRKNV